MLFDFDDEEQPESILQTAQTSIDAAISARPKSTDRKCTIKHLLDEAGWDGMTQHELADAMAIPLLSVCGLITPMVDSGTIIELGDTRQTRYGRAAKLIRLSQFKRNQP